MELATALFTADPKKRQFNEAFAGKYSQYMRAVKETEKGGKAESYVVTPRWTRWTDPGGNLEQARSGVMDIAVADCHTMAQAGKDLTETVGDGYGPMPPSGATNGDRQVATPLPYEQWQKKLKQ